MPPSLQERIQTGELKLTIPLVPPSVNHYKIKTRKGITFVTKEAKAFKWAVALFARGESVQAKAYAIEASVFLAKGQRGDGDNFWKCIADGLVDAGVIHSDAAVKHWVMNVARDPENPRTEILVRAYA